MATINLGNQIPAGESGGGGSYADRYQAPPHYRDRDHEFDAVKMGVWLFLATEVLLFSGMFVGYGVLRLLHPEAFLAGGHHLDVQWGLLNTIVLLLSSYTVASAVRCAQLGNIKWLKTYVNESVGAHLKKLKPPKHKKIQANCCPA